MPINISEIVRKCREEKGWTMNKLARESGLSCTAISEIESGEKNPKVNSLEKIADALGITLVEMLSGQRQLGPKTSTEAYMWLNSPNNGPYLEAAYKLLRGVSVEDLKDAHFFIPIHLEKKG